MSFTFDPTENLASLSFLNDKDDDENTRESIAGASNGAPQIVLPSPAMKKNRLLQTASRGSTPVSNTRSLSSSSSTTSNIDDLIPMGNYDHDASIVVPGSMGHFGSSLADRDLYRKKVELAPGHGHRDWIRKIDLLHTPQDLPIITLDELAKHNSRNDAWIAVAGNVYNVSEYLPFHPGGEGILLDHCGKDSTNEFELTHSFVNHLLLMGKYQVGYLLKTTTPM
jgi:cytochrome b involved in lipid metabolism